VLVLHDLLGIEERVTPKFVRRYANLAADARAAVAMFAEDVRSGRFPSSDETYHAADSVSEILALHGPGGSRGAGGHGEPDEPGGARAERESRVRAGRQV
jgi:3-methyl-2-oxobutanoate hydroxymethyltransferase